MKAYVFFLIALVSLLSPVYAQDDEVHVVNRGAFRPSVAVNYTEKEINAAVDFVDLAYKSYNLSSGNADKLKAYNDLSAAMEKAGYKITTFSGDTGHTALTNASVRSSNLGVLAESKDEVVIAFRGTKSAADLLTDSYVLNWNLVKDRFLGQETGGVHVGFNKTFESYRQELGEQVLKSIQGGQRNIKIVGHSLGGAQANLMALYLSQMASLNGYNVNIKLVTFNAPRVGSENFANKLNEAIGEENIARFTKGKREIVASAIPGTFGFKHAGTNVVVESDSLDKLKEHKMDAFREGAAGQAVEEFNKDPQKTKGFRTTVKETASTVVKGIQNVASSVKNAFSSFGQRLKGFFSRK